MQRLGQSHFSELEGGIQDSGGWLWGGWDRAVVRRGEMGMGKGERDGEGRARWGREEEGRAGVGAGD